jgi:hypothetical protein
MANPNVKPRFKKGSKEASEAGKKSKRPPSIATAIKKLLAESKELTPEILAESCIKHALKGSPQHIKLIMEYIDGKVPDKLEQKTDINVVYLDKQDSKL